MATRTQHQYRASFSDTTLPEMLFSIDRFRVPGVIEARSGGVSKRIFIRDGYVIHAASSDRRDSLGDYLFRLGKLSAEDLARVSRARQTADQRFGVLLIQEGLLTPKEIFVGIRRHIEAIIWSLFFWNEGIVTFSVGDFKDEEMVQIQLSMRQVIFQGIRRAPQAKPLVSRLGRKETVYESCFRWEDLIEIGLNADELRLLRLVDGKKSLYELCAQGPMTPAENAKLLYAFQVLHLVRRREPRPERTGPVKIQLKTASDQLGDAG